MRKLLLVFFTAMLCTGILGRQSADTVKTNDGDSLGLIIPDTGSSRIVEINRLLAFAEQFLGTPYRYGGKGPAGFDCSGFVRYCFSQTQGMTLSPSATHYFNHGIKVHPSSARPGDIICFTGSNSRSRSIGHVGIITEVTPTDIYFIHASVNRGICFDAVSSHYYKQRFLQIRRVLE
ncbi:MAG: NlpC/P60 family protein [Sphingomonadales bacterium]|nr:NlpC/P60 family protein [Sphingomonadales bacterium]